jgi:hypothetical protein
MLWNVTGDSDVEAESNGGETKLVSSLLTYFDSEADDGRDDGLLELGFRRSADADRSGPTKLSETSAKMQLTSLDLHGVHGYKASH